MDDRDFDIPDEAWAPQDPDEDDPASLLLADPYLRINGLPLHIEAIEVKDWNGVQVPTNPLYQPRFNDLLALAQVEAFRTAQIAGRTCVVFATPFSR